MALAGWFARAAAVAGAAGVSRLAVSPTQWRQAAEEFAALDGRLIALWASGAPGTGIVRAALAAAQGVIVLELLLAADAPHYPGLEDAFPAAGRMQRAVHDLNGAASTDRDQRPWLRHSGWPDGYRPLVDGTPAGLGSEAGQASAAVPDRYAFVRVEGDGVHEIPVGPVHAGIIEPGHFRFSIVGEKVLRLEERLGYTHKGIEQRFAGMTLAAGHRLAARVSGDSAAAYSWAYAQALEGLCAAEVPARAARLRAVCLELERIANHLGDLGALGNDAGFAFGLSQFSRLKEALLRATEQAWGQRYLMDAIVPGGTRADLTPVAADALADCVAGVAAQSALLQGIYDENSGVRDRFLGAGRVSPALAAKLGLTGLAGRASGQAFDRRVDQPWAPYDEFAPRKCGRTEGDVAARVAVRFEELADSCRLVRALLEDLPAGSHRAALAEPPDGGVGVGLIEGWRGPVLIGLEAGPEGTIRRCHPHDPSWQNWPVLEHAIIDNIVPDFPLINKSFNLSYSGHDL
jgi:Ni,Fe-hydrogenase III large subunit